MNRAKAIAAVATERGLAAQHYKASGAPLGSLHDGFWYVSECDVAEMFIDDCVWIVLPDGLVARGIPVGNPINPPTSPIELRRHP